MRLSKKHEESKLVLTEREAILFLKLKRQPINEDTISSLSLVSEQEFYVTITNLIENGLIPKRYFSKEDSITFALLCKKFHVSYPYKDAIIEVGGHPFTSFDSQILHGIDDPNTIDANGNHCDWNPNVEIVYTGNGKLTAKYIEEIEYQETLVQKYGYIRNIYKVTGCLNKETPLISLENNPYIESIEKDLKTAKKQDDKFIRNLENDFKEISDISDSANALEEEAKEYTTRE